jgi:putative flippase GtrA
VSSSTTSFVELKRIARYFGVGAAAACVDIGLFMLFAQGVGWPYLRVAAASFVAATLVNYALSVRFVFVSGARFRRRWEIVLVFAVSGVGLAINQAILAAGVEVAGLSLFLAKVAATGVVFFWNYAARRVFVFGAMRD